MSRRTRLMIGSIGIVVTIAAFAMKMEISPQAPTAAGLREIESVLPARKP